MPPKKRRVSSRKQERKVPTSAPSAAKASRVVEFADITADDDTDDVDDDYDDEVDTEKASSGGVSGGGGGGVEAFRRRAVASAPVGPRRTHSAPDGVELKRLTASQSTAQTTFRNEIFDDIPYLDVSVATGEESPVPTARDTARGPPRQIHVGSDPHDERYVAQAHRFADNSIKTSKYKWYNFVFKNLFEQFRRIANAYFFGIAVLNSLPGVSNIAPISSIAPLTIVLGVTMLKEGVEDYKRWRSDQEINARAAHIVTQHQEEEENTAAAHAAHVRRIDWRDVRVGQVIRLARNESVPADIVVLNTSLPSGLCYVETANLDGETNLKIHQALKETIPVAQPSNITEFSAEIVSEAPNNRIYVYEGSIQMSPETAAAAITAAASMDKAAASTEDLHKQLSLSAKNIILRGCVIRNVDWVYGAVVFTGAETKLMQNATDPPSKRSTLEKDMNYGLMMIFAILFIMCFACALASQLVPGLEHWYVHGVTIDEASTEADAQLPPALTDSAFTGSVFGFFFNFASFIVLFALMVPISLYVSMEWVKVWQAILMYTDLDMYYEPKDTPALPRTTNLMEELGQVEYIFSDKTGTLTCNEMKFRKASIAGTSYDLVQDENDLNDGDGEGNGNGDEEEEEEEEGKEEENDDDQVDEGEGDVHNGGGGENDIAMESMKKKGKKKKRELGLASMIAKAVAGGADGVAIDNYWRLLAVCHTVIPEAIGDDGYPTNLQAESPDELALVEAAALAGYRFVRRETNAVTIELRNGIRETYRVLNINEFNSTRKRMSVVVECPDGRLRLWVKGADSVVKQRLARASAALLHRTDAHLDSYARLGLRTLMCAERTLTHDEYAKWNAQYHAASIAQRARGERMDRVAESIETQLRLLGATAIEDLLQDGVPLTIANLRRAGIRVWVLTGDKVETAINIGLSCNLIGRDMTLLRLTECESMRDTRRRMEALLETHIKGRDAAFGAGGGDGDGDGDGNGEPLSPRVLRHRSTSHSSATAAAAAAANFKPLALVIDGVSLEFVMRSDDLQRYLLNIAHHARSVLCCRVSPLQKSLVVALVRHRLQVRCLAIGDGANDVAMIQAAQVGIGISGNEGMQAVMASDYAVAQFRYLETLLLVHGRWNYKRTSFLVLYSFYKNITFVLTSFWFTAFDKWSAQNLYDSWFIAVFNLIFTSLPVISYAIFEQDVSRDMVRQLPQLYESGLYNYEYSTVALWRWLSTAIYQSLIIYFGTHFIFGDSNIDERGTTYGLWTMGFIAFTVVVIVVNLRLALEFRYWQFFHFLSLGCTFVFYFGYAAVYCSMPDIVEPEYVYGMFNQVVRLPTFWLAVVLLSSLCLLPDVLFKYMQREVLPYNFQIAQELERYHPKLSQEEKERAWASFGDARPMQAHVARVLRDSAPARHARRSAARAKRRTAQLAKDSTDVLKKVGGFSIAVTRGTVDALRIRGFFAPSEQVDENVGVVAADSADADANVADPTNVLPQRRKKHLSSRRREAKAKKLNKSSSDGDGDGDEDGDESASSAPPSVRRHSITIVKDANEEAEAAPPSK